MPEIISEDQDSTVYRVFTDSEVVISKRWLRLWLTALENGNVSEMEKMKLQLKMWQ